MEAEYCDKCGVPCLYAHHMCLVCLHAYLRNHKCKLHLIMATHGHYAVVSVFLLLFSSPNLSGRRLDVCHTSTHDVALVRI